MYDQCFDPTRLGRYPGRLIRESVAFAHLLRDVLPLAGCRAEASHR